jgi:uncharacterized protein
MEIMAKKPPSPFPFPPKRLYLGEVIPMRVIRRYARAIAQEFQPDKIILFGSYAYGTPHEDSDVDLLVVMPNRNKQNQYVRIRMRLTAPFPMDLLVGTPKELKRRLEMGDSFMQTIVSKGKLLYEKVDEELGQKGRARLCTGQARQKKLWCRFMTMSASIASSASKSTSRA